MKKNAGTLLHITSLPNQFPIGDLGSGAYKFIDFLAASGQRWWQMLPTGPTKENNSPYSLFSGFAGNPLLISPELLVRDGFLNKKDILLPTLPNTSTVNYLKAKQFKSRLLKHAFKIFERENTSNQRLEFTAFVHNESYWLDDFALFSAIQKHEGTPDWTRWPPALKTRNPKALVRARQLFATDIRYYQFVQWIFKRQWNTLRTYAKNKGIALIGDIALFVAHHSPDVWAHKSIFKLNTQGKPVVTAGVPPDYFSKKGQLWHVPVYNWNALKKQNYEWWIQRFQNALTQFDRLRLDHFIGFARTYEVPANAKTAQNGKNQHCDGLDFFKHVRKALGRLPFFAEDLGIITRDVNALRNHFNLPGTHVLQFDFNEDIKRGVFSRRHYPKNSILYTGTHDNDTSQGWFTKFSIKQRKWILHKLHTNSNEFPWAMIHAALSTESNTVIVPMQDILGLDSEARMNTPGKSKGNWVWRMKKSGLNRLLCKKMLKLILTSKRRE